MPCADLVTNPNDLWSKVELFSTLHVLSANIIINRNALWIRLEFFTALHMTCTDLITNFNVPLRKVELISVLYMDCADLVINFSSLWSMLEIFLLCTYLMQTLLAILEPLQADWSLDWRLRRSGPFLSALHIPCADFVINFSALWRR